MANFCRLFGGLPAFVCHYFGRIVSQGYLRPYGLAMKRRKRFGVYFIFKSLEHGPTYRIHPARRSLTADR